MENLELFNNDFQKKQTPIEVALQVGEDGTVSARILYEFLELLPANFTTWYKRNITEDAKVIRNVGFTELFFEEKTPAGGKIKKS